MTDRPKLTLVDGAKPDPKEKLGVVGELEDGYWAGWCVFLMAVGFLPGLIGVSLAAIWESFWPLLLCAPFIIGLVTLLILMSTLLFVGLWNDLRRPR